MEPAGDVRFDGWVLHRSSGELLKDGVRVRLQSQPLAILEELLARPGEVVTREQLVARLWPRGIVDFDTALNSAVRRLRTALREQADHARYVETIPKRGYRFIGKLEQPEDVRLRPVLAPDVTPPPRSWWPIAAAFVLVLAILLVVATAGRPEDKGDRPAPGSSTLAGQAASVAPEAQARYVQARYLLQRRAEGDVTRSLARFGQAAVSAPRFAEAWAGLASAYWLETVEGRLPVARGLPAVRATAEQALALDPRLAEAHVRLANYWWRSGQRETGDRHLQQAIAVDPGHPLVLGMRASLASAAGQPDQAIELQRRAVMADPLATASRHNLVVLLYLAGRVDEARAALLEIRDINPSAINRAGLMSLVLVLGQHFESALAFAPDAPEEDARLQAQALAYFGLGRTAQAESSLRELLDLPRGPDPVRVAEVYAYAGQADLAFEWLRLAVETERSRLCAGRHCWPLELAEQSPFLSPLRSDPRWELWRGSVHSRASQQSSSSPG